MELIENAVLNLFTFFNGMDKLHNEDRHNLSFAGNIVRMVSSERMIMTCNTHMGNWKCVRIVVRKPEGK